MKGQSSDLTPLALFQDEWMELLQPEWFTFSGDFDCPP
jgi:hypothetical protein